MGRSVKGINLLNCLYYSNNVSLPVAFELVNKPVKFCEVKTQCEKRKSVVTKNEPLWDMLNVCCQKPLKWRYALANSWFSSSGNMRCIHKTLTKYFIFALKSNQLVALTAEAKAKGRYIRIDTIELSEAPVQGWVKGLEFPALFHRQVFINKRGKYGHTLSDQQ